MLNFSRWKIILICLICVGAIITALPNVPAVRNSWLQSVLPNQTIKLGLDLQGGSYLLLDVKFAPYLYEQYQTLEDDIRKALRKERIGYKGLSAKRNAVHFTLRNPAENDKIFSIIRSISTDLTFNEENNRYEVAYSEDAITRMQQNVLEQSIEIVRRRVDETGTTEPIIQRQGKNRILLQVPGLENPESLKRLLGKTAKMTFHLVNENISPSDAQKGHIPPDSLYLPGNDERVSGVVIKRKVMLSGNNLVNANAEFDENRQPAVAFRFDNQGGKTFATITKQYVGRRFAIVLDNKVLTAPVIRTPILTGTGIITGNFTVQSASDLAILLRAGALPAPLEIVEERTVGPSLGEDSILAGKNAIILAIAFVILFMLVTYRLFGLFSDIALVMNFILLFAVLSMLQATLTLPGIAGIVLTLGMAVDANILIFERIREELATGRTPFSAIEHGFRQAFKTILDSNLTTLIAATVLFLFGSGPIKGFAVTLSLGILASMFSAILLTRLMVVLWVKKKQPKTLKV